MDRNINEPELGIIMRDELPEGFDVIDLLNGICIMDFLADKGAYHGWADIQSVLHVRTRYQQFVDAINADDAMRALEAACASDNGAPQEAPNTNEGILPTT